MTGRDSADTSGYRPSYRALALRAGTTKSLGELLAAVDDDRLDRAGGQRPLADRLAVAALADVGGQGDDLDASSSISHRTATDVSSPPL